MTHTGNDFAGYIQRVLGCPVEGPIDCLMAESYEQSLGEISKVECADPSQRQVYTTILQRRDAPDFLTFDLEILISGNPSILEDLNQGAVFYMLGNVGGDKTVFTAFDRGGRFQDIQFETVSGSNLVLRAASDESMLTFSAKASPNSPPWYYPLSLARQTTTETETLKTIASSRTRQTSHPVRYPQEIMYAAGLAGTGVAANVLVTSNTGGTWAALGTDPFGNDEHIASLQTYRNGEDQIGLIAARGATDAGNPAEVRIASIDLKSPTNVVWGTAVDLPTPNGEFLTGHNSMYALNRSNIFIVSNAGVLAKSANGGQTWTALTSPVTSILNAVAAKSSSLIFIGGATNVLALSKDGGTNTPLLTGPSSQAAQAVTALDLLNENVLFAGYGNGQVWRSVDGGVNWTQVSLPLPTGATSITSINQISFFNDYDGAIAVTYTDSTNSFGAILRTVSSGAEWEVYAYGDNQAANATPLGFQAFTQDATGVIHAVGDASNSTSLIASITQPAAA